MSTRSSSTRFLGDGVRAIAYKLLKGSDETLFTNQE